MQVIYALVLIFSGAADRVVREGTITDVCKAIDNIDYSGDFVGWYITRNGQKIGFNN
jgi:hypothetical protein